MKRKQTHYLSCRMKIMVAILAVILLLMLWTLSAAAFRDRSFVIPSVLSWIGCFALGYGCVNWLYRPYKENTKVLHLFVTGYLFEGVFDQRVDINPETAQAMDKFRDMIKTNELISASKKQAQYLALQNQINPHFLYNTLEGIRGETMKAGLENVAKMTEALATFFQYTISNVEHLVTLEDELKNVQNYYIIQQYRFGERLSLQIRDRTEEEEEAMQYRLPKLTLQPIVENSIFHGIERKIGKGNLEIGIETTPKRLIITVSDDGLGIERRSLDELNAKLSSSSVDTVKADTDAKGGIAIVNVNSRIKLLFGEEYGICIYSTQNVGTDVEITLPLIKKDMKEIL